VTICSRNRGELENAGLVESWRSPVSAYLARKRERHVLFRLYVDQVYSHNLETV